MIRDNAPSPLNLSGVAAMGLPGRPLLGIRITSPYLPGISRIYLLGWVTTSAIPSGESIPLEGGLILVKG